MKIEEALELLKEYLGHTKFEIIIEENDFSMKPMDNNNFSMKVHLSHKIKDIITGNIYTYEDFNKIKASLREDRINKILNE